MIRNVKSGTVLLAVLLSLPIISNAKSLICPFKDKFTLVVPQQVKILSGSTQGNVHFTQRSETAFELSCANSSTSSGDLFIKIGYGNDGKCSLIIHDGPYELNPTVTSVYCNGAKTLDYVGMDHMTGTYDYKLKFTA